jgi:hypothetical protein
MAARYSFKDEFKMSNDKHTPQMAMRDKLWTEQDVPEQLETLRSAIIDAHRIIQNQHDMLIQLSQHQHLSDGRMVKLLDTEIPLKSVILPMRLRTKE